MPSSAHELHLHLHNLSLHSSPSRLLPLQDRHILFPLYQSHPRPHTCESTTEASPVPYTTAPAGTGVRKAAPSPRSAPSSRRHTNLRSSVGSKGSQFIHANAWQSGSVRAQISLPPLSPFASHQHAAQPYCTAVHQCTHLSMWCVRELDTCTSSQTQLPLSVPKRMPARGPSSGARKQTCEGSSPIEEGGSL